MRKVSKAPPYTPMYYLEMYKTTKRPRACNRCGQNAYYYHPDFHYVCAAHLLDLVNIGGMAFDWEEFPEVWQRTERLLQRQLPGSTGVTVTDTVALAPKSVKNNERLGG